MLYTILEIYEPDFGCEGVPDGQEPLCTVVLQSETSTQRTVKIADAFLYAHGLDVGSKVRLNQQGQPLL